jgi:very-short-patch-repair endonuclease
VDTTRVNQPGHTVYDDEIVTGFIVRGQKVAEGKVHLARQMRRQMTPAESLLWARLRASQTGYHFRKQQIIDGFVADFYCHAVRLVVEADGSVHDQGYDSERDLVFAKRGITVLRLKNDEIFQRIGYVLSKIKNAAARRG